MARRYAVILADSLRLGLLAVVIVGIAVGSAADSSAIIILAYLAAIAFSIWDSRAWGRS